MEVTWRFSFSALSCLFVNRQMLWNRCLLQIAHNHFIFNCTRIHSHTFLADHTFGFICVGVFFPPPLLSRSPLLLFFFNANELQVTFFCYVFIQWWWKHFYIISWFRQDSDLRSSIHIFFLFSGWLMIDDWYSTSALTLHTFTTHTFISGVTPWFLKFTSIKLFKQNNLTGYLLSFYI